MELWIRSQNKKELVKTSNIYIICENKWYHIYCYANDSEIDLGQYGDFEDKTRALEILDEIQDFLEHLDYGFEVYEMPQE